MERYWNKSQEKKSKGREKKERKYESAVKKGEEGNSQRDEEKMLMK